MACDKSQSSIIYCEINDDGYGLLSDSVLCTTVTFICSAISRDVEQKCSKNPKAILVDFSAVQQ